MLRNYAVIVLVYRYLKVSQV